MIFFVGMKCMGKMCTQLDLVFLCVVACLTICLNAKQLTRDECEKHMYIPTGSATCINMIYLNHGKHFDSENHFWGIFFKQHPECKPDERLKVGSRFKRALHIKNITEHKKEDRCHDDSESRCNIPEIKCVPTRYRTFDGSCNNLVHPHWGMAFTPQRRLFPPAYDDRKSTPRTKGCDGMDLPSARAISNIVHAASETIDLDNKKHSMMLMQWGQSVVHDIVLTPMSIGMDGEDLKCCTDDKDDPECFNIEIPSNDTQFPNKTCMPFARSFPFDCKDTREQENMQSGFIDGSHVYGANRAESMSLRSMEHGKLAPFADGFPLEDPKDGTCNLRGEKTKENYCPRAGDVRINENPGLGGMHVLFFREHNRLAEGLRLRNPSWQDEKIFQEARRIVIGLMQRITYSEWLPRLLGKSTMKKYGLQTKNSGFVNVYNEHYDPSIINAVATSILRLGHSMVHTHIGKLDTDYNPGGLNPLEDHFFNTYMTLNDGIGSIIRWLVTQKMPKSDRKMEDPVRKLLFKDLFLDAFDLAALNIQRGRDHGIPSYNVLRKWCLLPEAKSFSPGGMPHHSPENVALLKEAYRCPQDIDAFVGAMTEEKLPGALVGPLQACLLGKQFKALKVGDRFYHERQSLFTGFTKEQLQAIRKHSLAKIICDNTDTKTIQVDVFRTVTNGNPRVACGDIPGLDLDKWIQ